MKPFPALTPTLRNHATRLFNVHIHAFIVHIPLRSPRLCESLISRGISFLAKPLRALRHAYPSAQPWRSPRLCERPSREFFFSPSRKGRKDLHTPAEPWRSPRLCESPISRGIFFLAKPLRAQRHAYSCDIRCWGGLHALPRKMSQPLWKKHYHHFEMPPPLGKSVEHYLWKGMKPFPALVPPALKHVRMKLFSGSR